MLHDTIAAISTADVEAAISIVRMSGENAIEIANEIFSRNLLNVPSHTVHSCRRLFIPSKEDAGMPDSFICHSSAVAALHSIQFG